MATLALVAAGASAAPMLMESDIVARYSFMPPSISGKTAVFCRPDTSLVVEDATRRITLGGLFIWLDQSAVCSGGRCGLGQADAVCSLDPVLLPLPRSPRGPTWTVVLDPGHGGADTGAISPRVVLEKKVTLDIAKRVRRHLQISGAAVRLTRDRDRDLGLRARSAMAGQWKADLFVSIHMNSAANPQAEGIETYLCPAAGSSSTSGSGSGASACPGNRFDSLNMALACRVHASVLAGSGAKDRGIRRARFEVLTTAQSPAVLVECAFLSNPAEENRIISSQYRDILAAGIAEGIRGYITP